MMGDPIPDFLGAMEAAGVRPVEPIAQRLAGGGMVRFRAEGDKPGRQSGWAVLFLDGRPAGRFGHFKLGVDERWRSNAGITLDPAERRAQQAKWRALAAERAAELEARHHEAAKRAARLWDGAGSVRADHPYLVRKGMTGEGMRQQRECLLVPRRDIDGKLWSLQFIDPAGEKRFLKGARSQGLMFVVGDLEGPFCVGEGVSTMAAIRAETGYATAATFSADNLGCVAAVIREKFPLLDMVICADDDAHLLDHPNHRKNLGLEYARAAAAAVGARLAVPPKGD